ncbi:hypothetical protein TNCV_2892581 [Trichonephila clavipes]|nr:hypothetical protein TNCV_2892581 [Trichonephila clavipes]
MSEKGGNHLVSGLGYRVNALKLPNKAPRVSVVSGQSLASNCPVVDNRYLNLVFRPTEATHNKLFLSSPSWILVPVWSPFEPLHRALTMIVSHNIVVCEPFLIPSHPPFKKWVDFISFGQDFADRNSIHHVFWC